MGQHTAFSFSEIDISKRYWRDGNEYLQRKKLKTNDTNSSEEVR